MRQGPRASHEGQGGAWCVSILALSVALVLLLPGSAVATWWWPTQGPWLEEHHITQRSSWLGSSVEIDGDTLIVGTQFDRFDDGSRGDSGTGGDVIYVFEHQKSRTWEQTAKIVPLDAREGDAFGYSLALDEDAGLIAAGNPAAGKIYIFEETSGGSWLQAATFHPPSDVDGDENLFGLDVAVGGDTVVAAWPPASTIYAKEKGTWAREATIPGGAHVALEEETLVASRFDPSTGTNDFSVYTEAHGGWEPVADLDPTSPTESSPPIGCNVDVDETETTVVIGMCLDHRVYGLLLEASVPIPGGTGPSLDAGAVGSAVVYELLDGEWTQTATFPNPDPMVDSDYFGESVGVSGKTVVVGAPWDNENGARDGSGAAYVYSKAGDLWSLEAKLRNHDSGPYGGGDLLGFSIGVSGDMVAVGAPTDDQRTDDTPFPVDDDGDIPPCLGTVGPISVNGCDDGEDAGSVYLFQHQLTSDPAAGMTNGGDTSVQMKPGEMLER